MQVQSLGQEDPLEGDPPQGRKWWPTPAFSPGKAHGEESSSYSPWGRKESNMTEPLSMRACYCQCGCCCLVSKSRPTLLQPRGL